MQSGDGLRRRCRCLRLLSVNMSRGALCALRVRRARRGHRCRLLSASSPLRCLLCIRQRARARGGGRRNGGWLVVVRLRRLCLRVGLESRL